MSEQIKSLHQLRNINAALIEVSTEPKESIKELFENATRINHAINLAMEGDVERAREVMLQIELTIRPYLL